MNSEANAAAAPPWQHPDANRVACLGERRIGYHLARAARRSIGFSIGPDGLSVRAPRGLSLADIDGALQTKARWILAKLQDRAQRAQQAPRGPTVWGAGTLLPYLGGRLCLAREPQLLHASVRARLAPAHEAGAPARLLLGLPADAPPTAWHAAAQRWLLGQARRHYTARLDHFAPLLGVRWQRLTVSHARTRWGSASADGSIRLHARLIELAPPLIDYVVVHELAHLHEMNHGPRFWRHVAAVLPDHAARRAALRQIALAA